jgi:glycosyltransferase involved in cell wall biosynthesis
MKILALTSNYRLCGQGLAAHYICEALVKRGHDVTLQVFDSGQDLKKYFPRPRYKVDYRPSVPLMISTGIHVLKQVLYLLKLHRARGFDVALGLDSGDGAALGSAFAKEAGLPVAIIGWGNEFKDLGRTEMGFLRNCDLFLPVGRWAKGRLIEADFDEDRMKVLPPGVIPEMFRPAKRRPKGLGVLTVTRLVRGCGVDQLIKVLRTLLDRGHDAWLTVVGRGKRTKYLKGRVKKAMLTGTIRFNGLVHPKELAKMMREHHVLALVPRNIRDVAPRDFSLVMCEAASSGLGVVGTEAGGISDSLRYSGGIKAPAENPERIAKAIEDAARKSAMMAETEEAHGRMRAWEEVAFDLEMILDELVYE